MSKPTWWSTQGIPPRRFFWVSISDVAKRRGKSLASTERPSHENYSQEYHRTAGPWVALVVVALVAAATSPSFGQLTFDQSSYVRIDDSNTARQTPASQTITPITGGQSISFGAVDSDSVSGGGLIGSFEYFSSVLGSGTARYGSLGGKIDTDGSGTFDNGDIQGLAQRIDSRTELHGRLCAGPGAWIVGAPSNRRCSWLWHCLGGLLTTSVSR